MDDRPFSEQLEAWLKDHSPKTLANLESVFAEKSFAFIILILMAIPALPIPTGGLTHIFEIIVMVLSVELIIGRRVIWIPKKWRNLKISSKTETKLLPALTKRVKWLEHYSKPRLSGLLNDPNFLRVSGLVIFVLTFGALVAPPFSWLDTLPALGVVIVSLSLILEDALLYVIGCLIGAGGIVLEIKLAEELFNLTKSIFSAIIF